MIPAWGRLRPSLSPRRCRPPLTRGNFAEHTLDWTSGGQAAAADVRYALIMPTPDEPSHVPVADDDRLRRIESVTDAALAHLDVEDLLVELLDRVRELLEVETATVLLLDSSSQQLVVTAARGIQAALRRGIHIPVGKGFAGRIAAEKQPVIIERVDHANMLSPILREHGVCSLLGVPMLSSGTVIGVLHVGTLVPRRFTDDDVRLLQIVADRVAFATQSPMPLSLS